MWPETNQNWTVYRARRTGLDNKLIITKYNKARHDPKRVVFAKCWFFRILKAVQSVLREGIAKPILIGNTAKIKALIKENQLEIDNVPIIDLHETVTEEKRHQFAKILMKNANAK
ncbi:MAG: phosphate acyltransferase [Thiotrichaceae bacterium]